MRQVLRWRLVVATLVFLTAPHGATAQVGQLACDAPVTRSITSSSQVDNFDLGFNVAEGEVLAVRLLRLSTTAGIFTPVFTLVDRAGQQVADTDCRRQNGRADCGPLPASGNPYRLSVVTSGAGTGSYGLQVQRLGATCGGATLACDTVVSADISENFDTDVFELGFPVQEGEVLAVRVGELATTSGAFDVRWRLLDRSGRPVTDTDCRSDAAGLRDCGPLPASGNPYRIEVQDPAANGTGTYKIYVNRLTAAAACEFGEVPCDGTETDAISDPFELDLVRFEFPVEDGENVSISVVRLSSSGDFQPAWRLLDGRGIPVTDSDCNDSESGVSDCGPLAASGNPYRVQVYDTQRNGTGSYAVYVQRLTEPWACERHPVCRLDPPYERDLVSFDAHDQIVTVGVTAGATLSGSYSPRWRLIDGKGLPVSDPDCDLEGPGVRTCGPLPAFGNPYRIELFESGADGTGLYDVTIDGVSICGRCNPADPCCSSDGTRLLSAGTVCRAAAGVCDLPEACTGTSAACPADGKKTGVCRAAQGSCDVAEQCDGTRNACPTDDKAVDGTACSNGDFCDGVETCATGTCRDNPDPCAAGCNESTNTCLCVVEVAVGPDAIGDESELCVPIDLTNQVGVRGLEGIVTSGLRFSRIECGDRNARFSCAANQLADGRSVRFSILDVGGSCLPAGTGTVARVCFTSDDQVCRDTSAVSIQLPSVTVADCSSAPITPTCTSDGAARCVELGDCEIDRDVDLFDVLHMIDLVLEITPPEGAEQAACDTDCNGDLDIFDIFRMIDVLLEIRPRPLTCPAARSAITSRRSEVGSSVEAMTDRPDVPSPPVELRRRGRSWVVHVANDQPFRGIELTLTPTDGPVAVRAARPTRRTRGLVTEHRQADPMAPVRVLMTSFDDATVAPGRGSILTLTTTHRHGSGRLVLTNVKVVP